MYCSPECVSANWYSIHKSRCQASSQDQGSRAQDQGPGVSSSRTKAAFDLTQTLTVAAALPSDTLTPRSVRQQEPSALRTPPAAAPATHSERPVSRTTRTPPSTSPLSPALVLDEVTFRKSPVSMVTSISPAVSNTPSRANSSAQTPPTPPGGSSGAGSVPRVLAVKSPVPRVLPVKVH